MSAEVDAFLEVASATLPRITEIIVAFPAEHRPGALEVAERRYMQAVRDFGCTEADSECRRSSRSIISLACCSTKAH
jgi:hypothetical protein